MPRKSDPRPDAADRAVPDLDTSVYIPGSHDPEEALVVVGPGAVEPVKQRAVSSVASVVTEPKNSTFASRQAGRLERERQHGVPTRRPFGLPVGEDPDRNNFTITSTSDDGTGPV